jgi:SAM-dependent methyltransferase
MILGDATVEKGPAPGDPRPSALLALLTRTLSISEAVAAVRAQPHLSRAYPTAEAVVGELLDLDAAGVVRIAPRPFGAVLNAYYATSRANGDRSMAYVATYEKNWARHRDLYDFVEASDANAKRKALQRDNYLRHLAPHLDRLPIGAAVLDAGCGVGRLVGALLERGLRLTCTDASREALKCAVRVALRNGATADALDARLCDVRDMSCFDDGTFAATVALELICYQDDPAASLRELVRVTAPGGLVAVSAEGLHGSCIADPKLGPAAQLEVLDTAALDVEGEISVRYFTKDGIRSLLDAAGLEAIEVVGTQYTADGVFDALATDDALGDPRQLASLAALESAAAADPVLEPLARAWLATARRPGVTR